jgi:hypothetical protein
VSPIDDPNKYPFANFLVQSGVPLFLQGYFHSHSGATDFLKYYIQWYKTGAEPQIHSDSLYWAYRTQSKATTASTNIPPIGTVYGPLADEVYISANLKAPARLKVNAGNGVQTLNLHAGYNDVSVPFTAANNKPTFELDRGGAVVASGTGTDAIEPAPQYNDYYYSTGDLIALQTGDDGRGR